MTGLIGAPHRVDRETCVPRVSAFYGIVIWMYHDEIHHLGRPHFHARDGDDEASLTIDTVEVLAESFRRVRCGS